MLKNINIITYVDFNNGLSKNGIVPWNISEYYKKIISNCYQGKYNIVITNTDISGVSTSTLKSEDNLLNKLYELSNDQKIDKIFMLGGETMTDKILSNYPSLVNNIYMAKITKNYKCDKHFYFNQEDFTIVNFKQENKILFYVYQRINRDERQYLNLLTKILMKGELKSNKISLFGEQMVFDLEYHLPMITTRKISFRSLLHDLLNFINSDLNNKLLDNSFSIDKLNIFQSERLITIDNDIDFFYKFNIRYDKYLDCQLYQSNVDMTSVVPFNITVYSILIYMLCHVLNLIPGKLIYILGEVNIYIDCYEQVNSQVKKEPFSFPKLRINGNFININEFKEENFELVDYICHS